MSAIVGKIEGRGNGIKTVLVNAEEIAAQLHRPTEQFCKFFGCELGAQTKWDAVNSKAIVNGAHPTNVLQELVDIFCDKFVLCPSCNLPETQLKIKSNRGEIWHVCAACGEKTMVDMTHKLCTFILKAAKSKKLKKKEKKKKEEKERAKKKKNETPEEREARKKKEKKAKKKAKKLAQKEAAAANSTKLANTDEHGITWSTDFSDEAVRLRKLAEMAHRQRAPDAGDAAEEEEEQEEKSREQVLEESSLRVKKALTEGEDVSSIKAMAINLQVAGCLSATDRILIFYNAVMKEAKTPKAFSDCVGKYADIFEALVATLSTGPQGLLTAIELHFSDAKFVKLAPAVAVVLQAFYERDLLDEAHILRWYEKEIPAQRLTKNDATGEAVEKELSGLALVKSKAKPFVEWLKNAEEDSSESESGEEDE